MHRLTTDLMSRACRVFLPLAYAGNDGGIPLKKRCLLNLPPDQSMIAHLATDAAVSDCCQVLREDGKLRALWLRLGCRHYPHLKLKVQLLDHEQGDVWLLSVDTHDSFSKNCFLPPPGHPDAETWMQLQAQNAALKVRIEQAWDQAGLATFNSLLRRDLDQRRPSFA
jgi:hypothetical protein